MSKKVRIASFDIGKKNFSWCIEEFDDDILYEIEDIENKYNIDGTCTDDMTKILNQVYTNGKIILHNNVDLTCGCDAKKKLDPLTFHNMNDVLNEYENEWDMCSMFLIEMQMAFSGRINTMAVKLGQHCYSYFTFKYGKTKQIIEFPAYHKTQVLGAPKIPGKPYKSGKIRYKAMTKPQRKKWAVQKSIEILSDRGENDENIIKNSKKKDDLADTFLMIQAAKYMYYIQNV